MNRYDDTVTHESMRRSIRVRRFRAGNFEHNDPRNPRPTAWRNR